MSPILNLLLRSKRLLIGVCVVVGVLLLSGCGIAIPDTKGMTVPQATYTLESVGFKTGDIVYDENATGPAGTIIGQRLQGEKRAQEGSLIDLTVVGPPPVLVPDLSGLSREEAERALTEAELALGDVSEIYHASLGAGRVISQEPSANASVQRSYAVAVQFSKGPEPVEVLKVKGQQLEEAKKVLAGQGFQIEIEKEYSTSKKDMILSQAPAAGQKVMPGSTVKIVVSKGVHMVKVPNFVAIIGPQDSLAEVVEDIRNAGRGSGLKLRVIPLVNRFYSKQSPLPGVVVPEGTTITVWVTDGD